MLSFLCTGITLESFQGSGIFLKRIDKWNSSVNGSASCCIPFLINFGLIRSGPEAFFYEGRAKSPVTNRLPKFYPRYILKCFTALEWPSSVTQV